MAETFRPWLTQPVVDRLLGTAPDIKIARQLKRTTVAVAKRRRALRIPHFAHRPWATLEDLMLGTSTDQQVAHEIRRTANQVRERRKKLGILPWIYTPRKWTVKEELMVGSESDHVVAKRLRRSLSSVISKRESLGIPPFQAKCREWTEAEIKLLGRKPDAEVAIQIARTNDAKALEQFYTIKDVAELLKVDKVLVKHLVSSKKIKCVELDNGMIRIPSSNVSKYLSSLMKQD